MVKLSVQYLTGKLFEFLHPAKFAKNKDVYFAELLHKSLKGHLGTNHKVLIRTVVSRCERDMASIKEQFQEMYHKSLASMIEVRERLCVCSIQFVASGVNGHTLS